MKEKCCCPAAITPGLDVQGITQADQIARLAYLQKETADGLTAETAARVAADEQIAGQATAGDAANKALIDSLDTEVGQLQSEFGTLETNVSELGTKVQQQGSLIAANGVDITSQGERISALEDVTTLPVTLYLTQKLVDGGWTNDSTFATSMEYSARNGNFLDIEMSITPTTAILASTTVYRVIYTFQIPTAWQKFLPSERLYSWSGPVPAALTSSSLTLAINTTSDVTGCAYTALSKLSGTNNASLTISFRPPAIGNAFSGKYQIRALIPIVPRASG